MLNAHVINAARDAGTDLLVTVGGGSVTDAAKAVRLCLANGIESPADMDILRTRHDGNGHVLPPDFAAPRMPQISIPTTLSAGEFSAIAGVTDERHDTKEIFTHPDIIPQIAVLDPLPSRHTPEWLFLSTGIRAVDHCVEGICSHEANAYGDAQALKGLSLLVAGLMGVKADPGDMGARLDAQMGAWMSMGPLASGVPMGASHGIGYVLGAAFGVPHGYTSCVMLPAVMRWNAPANAARQALVADAMGEVPGAVSEAAADKLAALIYNLGMPVNLRAIEIAEVDFPMIAESAMNTPWVPRNPRTIGGPGDIIEILKIAV